MDKSDEFVRIYLLLVVYLITIFVMIVGASL